MPIEFAPKLGERLFAQHVKENDLITKGESWGWSAGLYTEREDDIVHNLHPRREYKDATGKSRSLEGYEVFAFDTIKELLKKKKDKSVIALDVGGGGGSSFNHLAFAFRKEVEEGKLAFVISNFYLPPREQLQMYSNIRKGGRNSSDLDEVIQQLFTDFEEAQNLDLVHFIDGPLSTVRNQTITFPTRQEVQLAGNVDFLHEKLSITSHTIIPEIDIPLLAALLSPYGVYPINKVTLLSDENWYRDERKQGITAAHRSLEADYGLQLVTHVETGPYQGAPLRNHAIFKRTHAPLITVYIKHPVLQ